MRRRRALALAGLFAIGGALGACSDEKKGEPDQLSKPAPPSDPTRPPGQKSEPPRPTEKPSEKF